MNEQARTYRIIVRLDEAEEKSSGGIILNATPDAIDAASMASDMGTIVDMGTACFNHSRCGDGPFPKIGDYIRFKQYCGYGFHEEVDGKKVHYSIINDDDFLTIVEKGNE